MPYHLRMIASLQWNYNKPLMQEDKEARIPRKLMIINKLNCHE